MTITPNQYYSLEKINDFIQKFKSTQYTSRTKFLLNLPMFGNVAEIGVAGGNFSECINSIIKPKKLFLIDCWKNTKNNEKKFNNKQFKLYKFVCKRFSNHKNIKIIKKFSSDAVKSFPDVYFDWIYIDANHDFKAVYEDLYNWKRKVKTGGIIAGNDYTNFSFFKSGVIEAVDKFCKLEKWEIYLIDDDPWHSFALRKKISKTDLKVNFITSFKITAAKYKFYNHLLLFLRNRGFLS